MRHIPTTYPDLYHKRNISDSVIEIQIDIPEANVISVEQIDIESQIQPSELTSQNINNAESQMVEIPLEAQLSQQQIVVNRGSYIGPTQIYLFEERKKKYFKCICNTICFVSTLFCFGLIIVTIASK